MYVHYNVCMRGPLRSAWVQFAYMTELGVLEKVQGCLFAAMCMCMNPVMKCQSKDHKLNYCLAPCRIVLS